MFDVWYLHQPAPFAKQMRSEKCQSHMEENFAQLVKLVSTSHEGVKPVGWWWWWLLAN